MRLFAIDTEHNITAFPAAEQIPEGQEHFASEKELAKLAASWPADRLVQIWNSFAGVAPFDDLKPVKKFTDRKTAVARLWRAIQRLDAPAAPQAADVAPKAKRPRKAAKPEGAAPTAREGSKKAIVLEMLRRPEGASLKDIMEATGWQAHSVRGFISGSLTKKMGLNVESFKTPEGARAYRIAK
ncbi:MAG TPA: DUF3489 domain-containing protein [Bryobacteraceae bacterium]|nr:DUF3489 domain-containing protein [Bryobacteraceae bacterium]